LGSELFKPTDTASVASFLITHSSWSKNYNTKSRVELLDDLCLFLKTYIRLSQSAGNSVKQRKRILGC